jgi:hypothetical protein
LMKDMKLAALVALLAAVPAGAAAQNKSPRDPIVQVGLFGYRADGLIGGSAYDTWPDLTSTVYVLGARCGMGAGNRIPPEDASDIWEFTGKVLSETDAEAVVHLSWRRVKIAGRTVNGDESTTQLTLRRGEAQQLDQASIQPRPGCPTVAVAFEARYSPRMAGPGYPPGLGVGGITSGTPAHGSGGGMAVARGTQSVQSGAAVAVPRASGDGGGVRVGGPEQSPALWDVNLWLVRTVPGKAAESTHTVLKMNKDGATFTFAPVVVATNRGEATVRVSGTLDVVRGSSGEEQLVFTAVRRVNLATANQASPDHQGTQGTSRVFYRMPAPGDVLAFEMPPLTIWDEPLAPDVFAVRLTVEPRRQ